MVGMTPQHFAATFKAEFGTSPHQYIIRERIRKSRKLLASRRHSVAEIAFLLGFSSQSHFTAKFRTMMGVTPAEYRRCL
jgi:AraC family transcriptional regulator